jgi:mannose-6-phosphate isomerase-like protein (cupin superfamily)
VVTAFEFAADGTIEGYLHGSQVSIIRSDGPATGTGPRLHRHPYEETFVIHSGRALFTVGEDQLVAGGGQLLVVPALIPHRFEVLDGGRYVATHIHAHDRFVTEWLD